MSSAFMVFRPACSANFSACCASFIPCSSSISFRAAFAESDTLSAPAFLINCSIAASGTSLSEGILILEHTLFKKVVFPIELLLKKELNCI